MALPEKLNDRQISFIQKQPLFFVATAAQTGRVNLSPKGLNTLRVIDHGRIVWLSLSGSGNETAAHVLDSPRMTLMFCAFEGDALILRTYGSARLVYPRHADWAELAGLFPDYAGSRQIYDLSIDLVQTSCGTGVPEMQFIKSRGETEMVPFFEDMGPEKVEKFWRAKNTVSLDGTATGIFEHDTPTD